LPPQFLTNVQRILQYGLTTNSYKYALLRALAAFGKGQGGENTIPFTWLAEQFLAYYWPFVTLRIRQATDQARDPVIMRFIRDVVSPIASSTHGAREKFRNKNPRQYQELLDRCCRSGGCFDEVVPRLHKIPRRQVDVPLYDFDMQKRELQLRSGVRQFLKEYSEVVELLSIGAWVHFTEKYTTQPRLYEKIAGIKPERHALRYKALLHSYSGGLCFYCKTESSNRLDVEHVIPWSFVFEDRIWNLVLACQSCNSSRSDQIPIDSYIEKLNERNRDLLTWVSEKGASTKDTHARKDFKDFQDRNLGEHLRTLVQTCRDEGFGTWNGPTNQ
jgi:5-methylcytosine-specific restriction endonuclease McrA